MCGARLERAKLDRDKSLTNEEHKSRLESRLTYDVMIHSEMKAKAYAVFRIFLKCFYDDLAGEKKVKNACFNALFGYKPGVTNTRRTWPTKGELSKCRHMPDLDKLTLTCHSLDHVPPAFSVVRRRFEYAWCVQMERNGGCGNRGKPKSITAFDLASWT